MADDGSTIQTYAIVPYAKWKTMEQRLQRAESEVNSEVQEPPTIQEAPSEDSQEDNDTPPPIVEEDKKKNNVKLKYQKSQIKKLLHHIESLEGVRGSHL